MKQKVGEFIFGEIKSFISNRTNILLSIQGFFGSVPWGLMSVFLPYAVMEKFNCDFASAGLLLSVMIVGYVFSIPPIHYLDRLRMRGKLGIVGLFPAFSIFMQAIIFLAIFSIPSPDKEIHLIPLIKVMSIVEIVETIQKFFGQGSIVTIMVLIVLFSFFSVFAGPITRNIIIDVNPESRIGGSIMILRLFELSGQTIGLIVGGILIDTLNSFVGSITFVSLSWFISVPIWIIIGKYYRNDMVSPIRTTDNS